MRMFEQLRSLFHRSGHDDHAGFDMFRSRIGASRTGLLDRPGGGADLLTAFRSLVFACINVRAREVANAGRLGKFRVMREVDHETFEDVQLDHPLVALMRSPNPYLSRWFLWYLTVTHLDLTGNAYWWIATDSLGVPRALWPIPPHHVRLVPGDAQRGEPIVKGYRVQWSGAEAVEIAADAMVHLRHPDPASPYYYGSSLVMRAAAEIDIDDFISAHQREFFKNDATPGAVVEFPSTLSRDVRKAFESQWIDKFSMKPGKIAFLEGGAKLTTMVNQKELDYLQSRGLNHKIIQAVFGVPDSKLMNGEAILARATMDALDYTFHKETIDPLLTMIDEQLTNDLARRHFDRSLIILHDATIPRDLKLQADLDQQELAMGKVSINEVRLRDGYAPIPGGDEPLVESGIVPLSTKSNIK